MAAKKKVHACVKILSCLPTRMPVDCVSVFIVVFVVVVVDNVFDNVSLLLKVQSTQLCIVFMYEKTFSRNFKDR